ncbi:MAG: protocatechuate 3,4-dioxygenase subunit beta [Burkholderiales bacterium]
MSNLSPYRKSYFDTQPDYLYPAYRSTVKRAPAQPLVQMPQTLSEITGPLFAARDVKASDADLTAQHAGAPLGERMFVTGRVLDENGKPMPNTLIEMWQANAAGRYKHIVDDHDAPMDPNFTGFGRAVTDANGHYRFKTIKPGAYPWRNHYNAWRPAHLHFSLFGQGFAQRLVTQMYFPGDPLLEFDPMYMSVPNERARQRLVSSFDWENTVPEYAIAYRFDIILRGRDATPMEATKVSKR